MAAKAGFHSFSSAEANCLSLFSPWQVWFEVSGNTGRVHFHAAPDGTRPLLLSLPIESLTGPCDSPYDSPMISELLEAVSPAGAARRGATAGMAVAAAGPAPAAQMPAAPVAEGPEAVGGAADEMQAALTAAAVGCEVGAAGGLVVVQDGGRQGSGAFGATTAAGQAGTAAATAAASGTNTNTDCSTSNGQVTQAKEPVVVIGGIGPVALGHAGVGLAALRSMLAEARAFALEWQELRAVLQSRLAGKVLRAPLDEAAEAVQKAAAAAGALGCSTSRFVGGSGRPDLALPEGAEWREVRVRFPRCEGGNSGLAGQQEGAKGGGKGGGQCGCWFPGADEHVTSVQGGAGAVFSWVRGGPCSGSGRAGPGLGGSAVLPLPSGASWGGWVGKWHVVSVRRGEADS